MDITFPRSLRTTSGSAEITSIGPVGRFNTALPEIWVETGLCKPITAKLETDLPEPDSPTIANVSPKSTEYETLLDALTKPSGVGNPTDKFLTSRNLVMIVELVDLGTRIKYRRLSSLQLKMWMQSK